MVTPYQKGLFADKSTLILRSLLQKSEKQWRTRELAEQCGISQGLVSRTVVYLEKLGYAQTQKGRNGYIRLVDVEGLLKDWVSIYDFSLNSIVSLYSPDENALSKLKTFLLKQGGENCYALTLHTGANLMTNYVRDPNIYVYLLGIHPYHTAKELQMQLGFKKLVQGGNVHLIQ
ncbi:MAG: Rrf2 family transcriptional regulator, partial [Deltaproteobacteria bacterium]|nr:Rrf2 family transcriptional regulator [Deltaproteobacteria bacterium]